VGWVFGIVSFSDGMTGAGFIGGRAVVQPLTIAQHHAAASTR
jgi:hypothetical protein